YPPENLRSCEMRDHSAFPLAVSNNARGEHARSEKFLLGIRRGPIRKPAPGRVSSFVSPSFFCPGPLFLPNQLRSEACWHLCPCSDPSENCQSVSAGRLVLLAIRPAVEHSLSHRRSQAPSPTLPMPP